MDKKYSHLNLAERVKNEKYLDKGYSVRAIANLFGRNPSAISRKLNKSRKRNEIKAAFDYWINLLLLTSLKKNRVRRPKSPATRQSIKT